MAPKMQLKIVSRDLVKPSSSTPNNHPSTHNLSFFDQFFPCSCVPLIFFYKAHKNNETNHHNYSTVLKNSLSAVLSHYYPLAGRVRDNITLDCNDEGVLFIEATMENTLSEFLKDSNDEILKLLFPDSLFSRDSFLMGPVAVQVTYFRCGGMSIGLCLCHKILDMESMSSFISDWASLARKPDNIGSLFPPVDLPIHKTMQQLLPETKDCVFRRVVFDGLNIAKLRAKLALQVPNPTRVEVVSALLYKSAVSAAARASSSGRLKSSVMKHVINLRTHVSPPLSKRNIGNLFWTFQVSIQEDRDAELERLVKKFRDSKIEFSNCCATRNNEELCSMVLKSMEPASEYFDDENEVYLCTSWCRFPFYETDFGWGKPLWAATICVKTKNMIVLIDTREGGIEAYVVLEEKVMAIFENDQDLLSFSCVNPDIVSGLQ